MSTILPSGLEIRRLAWKDDIFKMATVPPPTADGWYDNTGGNSITFANGTIETYGTLNLVPSTAITDGDALALPASIQVEHDIVTPIPHAGIGSIRLRAKNAGSGSSDLSITLLDNLGNPILPVYIVTLASALFTHYTISVSVGSDVGGVQMECTNGAIIDYIALGTCEYVNQGGLTLNLTIDKATQSLAVPNTIDIIQQLGIASRSIVVMIPKASVSLYNWLEDKMVRSIPLEWLTPTQQATGYLLDIKKHTEWGWVSRPLASSDALAVTATPQQLYDITGTLAKSDNEQNTDTTASPCVNPNPPIPPQSITLPNSYFMPYEAVTHANGRWWVFLTRNTGAHGEIAYIHSSDGVTWSSPVTVLTTATQGFVAMYALTCIRFFGTTVYYVVSATDLVSPMANCFLWSKGILNANGTITWAVQNVQVPTTYGVNWPSFLDVDNLGNVWVALTYYPAQMYVEVWRYNGSIWTDFTANLNSLVAGPYTGSVLRLTGSSTPTPSLCTTGIGFPPSEHSYRFDYSAGSWSISLNTTDPTPQSVDGVLLEDSVEVSNINYCFSIKYVASAATWFTRTTSTATSYDLSSIFPGSVGTYSVSYDATTGTFYIVANDLGTGNLAQIYSTSGGGTWSSKTTLVPLISAASVRTQQTLDNGLLAVVYQTVLGSNILHFLAFSS
jgi:hypothetical protein